MGPLDMLLKKLQSVSLDFHLKRSLSRWFSTVGVGIEGLKLKVEERSHS